MCNNVFTIILHFDIITHVIFDLCLVTGIIVDTSFCLGYHGSSAHKKKFIAERRKVAQDDFQGGRFFFFNFGPIFDLLNGII